MSGEHAVLRGHPALVFPLPQQFISWQYWRSDMPLTIALPPESESRLIALFWQILHEALQLLGQPRTALTGKFLIDLAIPMGAGMGFSAAFCVGLTRWLIWQRWLAADELFSFARQLENYFHGQSSGVDIAGSMHDQGIQFSLPDHCQALALAWQPMLYLSYCGQTSMTTACIRQVNGLRERDAALAIQIDQQMAESVHLAREALAQAADEGLSLLQQALALGQQCFVQWGLVSSELQMHMQQLTHRGALAVKSTGAGAGGYVLSLWDEAPADKRGLLSVW